MLMWVLHVSDHGPATCIYINIYVVSLYVPIGKTLLISLLVGARVMMLQQPHVSQVVGLE